MRASAGQRIQSHCGSGVFRDTTGLAGTERPRSVILGGTTVKNRTRVLAIGAAAMSVVAMAAIGAARQGHAQKYAGPLAPHVGAQLDYAFANRYGPDAEARVTFTAVNDNALKIDYSSTRGLFVKRDISVTDREFAKTYVLGYSAKMPQIIPRATSLGISSSALLELRNTGRTQLRIVYDEKMSALDGELIVRLHDL